MSGLRRRLAALAGLPLLLAATGCGDPFAAPGTDGAGVGGDGPTVVASFYPLAFVAERVAGTHADVTTLTTAGAEPHDLELTVDQTARLAEADLVVFSQGFQPAVDEAVDQQSPARTVEAMSLVDPIPVLEDAHGEIESSSHLDEHGDPAEGVALDPHFWLDPGRLARVAGEVADQLADVDPQHAGDYRANLADLEDDLEVLDREIAEGLTGCERDTVVVSHNAFGYFAIHYGVHMRAISGLSPDAEPSPAQLRTLSDLIREKGITTVFSERLATADLADTLARELDLRTAVLDPVEGLTEATADEDYLSLMRDNLAALRTANGCP